MSGLRLFYHLTLPALGRLCRQGLLLAGLVLLCMALPLLAGIGAEALFSEGVAFSAFTLAVTAPEGDPVPQALEDYLGVMTDVRQYCQVEAMDQALALEALEDGQVTAVLVLPEDFIRAVQRGENPDVRLIVDSRRPLESLLTFWVGQSAADLLAAVQSGIYYVLDQWEAHPAAGPPKAQVVLEINLRYVQWVLQRQDLFKTEVLLPTGTLPIALHYRLCLLWYLLLSTAPLFAWSYQGTALAGRRRLRYALRSPLYGYFSGFAASWAITFLLALAALLPLGLPPLRACGTALVCGGFLAAYAAFCGLVSRTAAGSGTLSFLLTMAFLTAAGGIVPPVLLPEALRRLEVLSPVAWMRDVTAWALDAGASGSGLLLLPAVSVMLLVLSAPLYCRRIERAEVTA